VSRCAESTISGPCFQEAVCGGMKPSTLPIASFCTLAIPALAKRAASHSARAVRRKAVRELRQFALPIHDHLGIVVYQLNAAWTGRRPPAQ